MPPKARRSLAVDGQWSGAAEHRPPPAPRRPRPSAAAEAQRRQARVEVTRDRRRQREERDRDHRGRGWERQATRGGLPSDGQHRRPHRRPTELPATARDARGNRAEWFSVGIARQRIRPLRCGKIMAPERKRRMGTLLLPTPTPSDTRNGSMRDSCTAAKAAHLASMLVCVASAIPHQVKTNAGIRIIT